MAEVPALPGQVILSVDVLLAAEDGPEEAKASAELVGVGEDATAASDGDKTVKGRRQAPGKGEWGELAAVGGEGKGVRHPGEVVGEAGVAQEAEEIAVGAEEDMETALKPVAVGILPGGDLAASDLALLEEGYFVAETGEVGGRGQAGQPGPGDSNGGARVERGGRGVSYTGVRC